MHDREEEIVTSRITSYCKEHDRYYRADTGCVLCNAARGALSPIAVNKEITPAPPVVTADICHYCGGESLVWKPGINMYECHNPVCKRRVSQFTQTGLGELLNEESPSREIPSVTEHDARVFTRNFAVGVKKPVRFVEENDIDNDIAMPYDAEIAGYSQAVRRVPNKKLANLKSILIFLAFVCLALAVWAGYLLVTAGVDQGLGTILLVIICAILVWSVYGIMSFKKIGVGFAMLLFCMVAAAISLSAVAGIEPISSVIDDIIWSMS